MAVTLLPITSFFPHSTAYADDGEDGGISRQLNLTVTFVVEGNTYEVYTDDFGLTEYIDNNSNIYYLSDIPNNPALPFGMVSFRGWFLPNATEPFDFNTQITGSLTLTAQFSNTYLVKFKDGDGKVVATREYLPGAPILQPSQAVIDEVGLTAPVGSHLDYWYIEGGNPNLMFTFGTTTASADITLLPRFSDYWYVIFVSAGTQVNPNVQLVTNGGYATMPSPNPTRPGYNFAYWSTVDQGQTPFSFSNRIYADTMLYAVWTPQQVGYTVAIWMEKPNIAGTPTHVNGDKSQYNYVTSVSLMGLAGSTTAVNGSTAGIGALFIADDLLKYAEFQDAEQQVIQGNGLTVVNLYASRKVYTFRFDLGEELFGNSPAGRSMTVYGTTYYAGVGQPVFTLQVKYEQDISNLFPVAGLGYATFSNTLGYAFRSWAPPNELEDNTTHFASRQNSVNKGLLSPDGATLVYTYVASWQAYGDVFNYRYLAQALPGQAVTPQNSIVLGGVTYVVMDEYSQAVQARLVQKVINGLTAVEDYYWDITINQADYQYPYTDWGEFLLYTWSATAGFQQVNFLSAAALSDRILFANTLEDTNNYRCFFYTRDTFALTFDLLAPPGSVTNAPSNATLMFQQSLAPFEPVVDPSRTGYIFAGWYRDADFMEAFDFSIIMPNGPMIVYAKWESDQNIVRFFDNYGSTNQVDQEGVANGGYVTRSFYTPGTAYPGYGEFRGWYFVVENRLVPFYFDMPIWRDYDLYAVWRTDGFTITYNAGLGSGTVPVDNNTYELGTLTRAAQPGSGLIPPAGLVFYAWLSSTDAEIYYPGNLVPMFGDTVLTAQYARENDLVTFTYIENYAGSTATYIVHPVNGSVITLAGEVFTRPGSGSRLVGWNSASNGTGTSYALDQPGFAVNGNMTFYGVWDLADYTVTVNNSFAAVTGAGTYHFNDPVTINAGTRDGYTFAGWTVDSYNVTLVNPTLATTTFTMPAGDVEVTANWTPRPDTPYKVEHYLVSATGAQTLQDTDNLTGTTGTTVNATPRTYPGYTYDPNYPGTINSGTIAGDGSLVLRLYYVAGTAPYKVEHYLVSGTGTETLDDTENLFGTVGTTVTATPRTYAGYAYDPAYPGTVSSGMVAGDGSLVLKLYYTATSATYDEEIYLVDAANVATLFVTYTLTGIVGTTVNANPQPITGYTLDPNYPGTRLSGVVAADNSLVLRMFYRANADTPYKVEHYLVDSTGLATLADTDNLTGTTGTTVYAAPRTYLGYTYNPNYPGTIDFGTIAADGSLVLKLYYVAGADTPYTVEHYLVNIAGAPTLEDTDNLFGVTGTYVAAVPRTYAGYDYAPTYPGTVASGTIAADGSLVLKLYYTPRNDTPYKVEHYLVDTAGTATLDTTENLLGTTGATVTAVPRTYPGYTYDPNYPGTILTGVIAGDGSLVLKLYYTASADTPYKVEHYLVSASGAATLEDTDNLTGTTGATVTAVPRTYPGYTYDPNYLGTVASGTILGDGSLVLKLFYTADTLTPYTVEHYLVGAAGATLEDTDNLLGATGTYVAATPRNYLGYDFAPTYPGTVASGIIAADGSLVLKLYYTPRNDTPYKVEHYLVDAAGTATLDYTENLFGTTGTTVNAVPRTYAGYTYDPNYSGTISSGVIAGDGSLVLKLYYTPRNDTPYKVEHYLVTGAGVSVLTDTENLTGTTGTIVSAVPRTYPGYTFAPTYAGTIASGTIAGDGSLVLRLYYTANNLTPYTLEHYLVGTGGATLEDTENLFGTTDTYVAATPRNYPGYNYAPTYPGTIASGIIAADGSLVLKLYYTPRDDTPYKVEHYLVSSTGQATLDFTENLIGTTGTTANAVPRNYPGYTFAPAYVGTVASGIIAGDGSLVLRLYYTANTDTPYKVEHYKVTGAGVAVLADTENLTGTTGTSVSAVPRIYPGYTFAPAYLGTVASGIIAGDGSLVLRLYYTADTLTPYTVEHYLVGAGGATLEDTENLFGTTDTYVAATPRNYLGYTYAPTYPGTIASGIIAADGSLVLKLYYTPRDDTPYRVEHYLVNNAGTPTLDYTETQLGTTGTTVNAVPRTYAGYTYDPNYPGTISTGVIAGDGSLVLKLYYTASFADYTVEHYLVSATGQATLEDTENLNGSTGANVSATPRTYPGYTYAPNYPGTISSGAIAADGSLVLKLYYTANADTPYKVEHYLVNANGQATLDYTENLFGPTGTSVTAVPRTYLGYTYAPNYPGTLSTGVIAGDGSLVLKLYYTADALTPYKVEHYLVSATGTETLADTDNLFGPTGNNVSATPRTYAGYTYAPNYPGTVATGVIAGDGSLVLKLYYTANADTPYKVEHYKVSGANVATLADTDNLFGPTGNNVSAVPRTYPGYTYAPNYPGTVATGVIAGDGSLVLKLYYTANTYFISYNGNNATSGTMPDQTVVFDSPVTLAANAYARLGYTFGGWNSAADGSGVSYADQYTFTYDVVGDLGLYAQWDPIFYTVVFDPGEHGLWTAASQTYPGLIYGQATPAAPQTVGTSGYEFVEWSPAIAATVTGDATYTAIWRPEIIFRSAPLNAGYTVNHYNVDNGDLILSESLIGRIGSTVTAESQTFTGYTFNPAASILEGVVVADGSLVLFVFYTPVVEPVGIPAVFDPVVSIPPTFIPDDITPAGIADATTWSLLNLILSLLGVLMALGLFAAYFVKTKKEEELEDLQNRGASEAKTVRKKSMTWRIVAVIAAFTSLILFFLTADISGAMSMFDYWTIAHAIIFILQIAFMALALRKKEDAEFDDGSTFLGSPAL